MSIVLSLVAAISGATVSAAIPPVAVPTVETAASAIATAPSRTDLRRYCVSETPTGSRIPVKECRTRAEWAAKGVDIDAK